MLMRKFDSHARIIEPVAQAVFLAEVLRRSIADVARESFELFPSPDKTLWVLGRFKRQPHLKSGAVGTCFEFDFSAMPFGNDAVADHQAKPGP